MSKPAVNLSDPHVERAAQLQHARRETFGGEGGSRPVAVSLFDESGNMLRPWAEAGWECWNFDKAATGRTERIGAGVMHWKRVDLLDPLARGFVVSRRPEFLTSFGPCDHLAGCGAKHFAAKRAKDPEFQKKALALWKIGPDLGEAIGCAWMAENPVGVIPSMWRDWDHIFDPCDYGGYLPEDDRHPRWPQYITPRDAYTKKTCIWSGGGFVMPPKRRVTPYIVRYENGVSGSQQFAKLGGKSAKTKQIRSETPRGFALAAFEANGRAILQSRRAA